MVDRTSPDNTRQSEKRITTTGKKSTLYLYVAAFQSCSQDHFPCKWCWDHFPCKWCWDHFPCKWCWDHFLCKWSWDHFPCKWSWDHSHIPCKWPMQIVQGTRLSASITARLQLFRLIYDINIEQVSNWKIIYIFEITERNHLKLCILLQFVRLNIKDMLKVHLLAS